MPRNCNRPTYASWKLRPAAEYAHAAMQYNNDRRIESDLKQRCLKHAEDAWLQYWSDTTRLLGCVSNNKAWRDRGRHGPRLCRLCTRINKASRHDEIDHTDSDVSPTRSAPMVETDSCQSELRWRRTAEKMSKRLCKELDRPSEETAKPT
jgi:hypothetical protein